MTRIGGGLFASKPTREGESVLWSVRANRQQGSRRAVGGRFHLTTERLVFTPHLLDAALGGRPWVAERSEIVRISKEPRDASKLLGGGLRGRLRIEIQEEPPKFFVVNELNEVINRLRESGAAN